MRDFLMRRGCQAAVLCSMVLLSGCETYADWLPASGASRGQIQNAPDEHGTGLIEGIHLVDVTDTIALNLANRKKPDQFAAIFPDTTSNNYVVGPGDIVEVTVWEAPPAMLFGISTSVSSTPTTPIATTTAFSISLPTQMVDADGTIAVPFAGRTLVKGHTIEQIEAQIVKQLQGKANQPQVLVNVTQNNSANVTIVGDVTNSLKMPVTPRGERVLDAVAAAGGVKQTTSLMALRLTRGGVTATMPVDAIIRDPAQNVLLDPGDVITALYQPQTFDALGATGKNTEFPFEAVGISLAQALARAGGLNDSNADARGVFVFRFEDANLVVDKDHPVVPVHGIVPVVYEIDLRNPGAFFITQHFPIQNHDVVYIANAPVVELEKFVKLVTSIVSIRVTN